MNAITKSVLREGNKNKKGPKNSKAKIAKVNMLRKGKGNNKSISPLENLSLIFNR